MSPIPNKGFFDEPYDEPSAQEASMTKKLDSLTHHEERRAQMQAETAARIELREAEERKRHEEDAMRLRQAKEAEAQRLEQIASGLVREGETREMLMERIRQLRAIKEPEVIYPPLSASQQAQLEREQQAGREAVARAQALEDEHRARWYKEEEDAKKTAATTTPVYRLNEPEPNAIPPSRLKK